MSAPILSIGAVSAEESPDRVRADSLEIANLYESGPAAAVFPRNTPVDSAPQPRDGVTRVSPASRIARGSEDTLGSNVDFLA